jgi:hypothetical protein
MVASVGIVGPAHIELDEVAKIQRFAKLAKENQSTKACHGGCIEGKNEFLRPSTHSSNSYHKGTTLSTPIYSRKNNES